MRCLGIDPGLAIAGWAVLEDRGGTLPQILDHGTLETCKTLTTPQRLTELEQDMIALVREFSPQMIAMEMPFFGRQIRAAGAVLQAVGVINLVCYRESQILPVYLHQASWKTNLGNGQANKKEVAALIQQLFDLPPLALDDTMDAIGIAYAAICGVRNDIH